MAGRLLVFGILAVCALGVHAQAEPSAKETVTIRPDKGPDKGRLVGSAVAAPEVWKLFSGMAVILVAVVVILWLLKRLGRMTMTANNQIQVLGGVSLGAREKLVLVQVADKQMVLGVAPGSVRTLYVLEQPISIEDTPPGPFGRLLSEKLRQVVQRDDKK